jgi:hypothetical protein
MSEIGIRPYYELRLPSRQTVADLFQGAWKSSLPDGLLSGNSPMFEDNRPFWVDAKLPNGIGGKSILEFGPFEGYQTYLLAKLGAKEIISVDANSINFLKCLCLKEMFSISTAHFEFGDLLKYASACQRRFDLVWASGVLYHMNDPIGFIKATSKLSDNIFIWTHYFDESLRTLSNGQERHFIQELDKVECIGGRQITLHARSYLIENYNTEIPRYWEGGIDQITYWLSKDDIIWLLQHWGMEVVAIESVDTSINGLPVISFLARANESQPMK